MTRETLVVGIVALLIGAALTFAGYRYFLLLLPIFGFVAGFYVGSAAVTALFGDGFLSTVTGWVVGLVGGVSFAVLSYLFFYLDVIILSAVVGASIGSGLMVAIGFNDGFLTFIVAAIGAIALAVAAIALAVPKYLVILVTSIAGATSLVGGVLLIFGTIKLADLQEGAIVAIVRQAIAGSLMWSIVALALIVVGVLAQTRVSQMYVLDPEGSRLG